MLHIANKWIFTLSFFFIMAVFLPVQESVATTFRAIYADAPGTGFYDETHMTDQLAQGNIIGTTVGEVRRNAFEAALDILEENISTNNNEGVVIQASFDDLGAPSSRGIVLGGALPADHVFLGLVPGLPVCSASSFFQTPPQCSVPLLNEPGVVGVPLALAEHITGQGFNGNNPDILIKFNERAPFYFGTETTPFNYVNFVLVAAHELFHGLGFYDSFREDGSFIALTELGGSLVPVFSYYDINLYSESEEDLLVNLSQSERRNAITSVDGLSWDGTLGGLFDTSCGQLMGEALMDYYPSAVDKEGRPQLYAPRPYEPGSSISHFVQTSKDLMKPSVDGVEHADFTLGVLLDMLWVVGDISPDRLEVLEDCLTSSGGETEPESTPAPDTPGQSSGGGSGGGCTIAETQAMSQNTILNLLLILLTMVPCFQLYRRGG
ncbi:MAG: hypothetical protein F4Z13_06430 [Candidatus Dadabacteria bacterium]|nr:hypothetical protein [Candidatus Dadabacteria bacterium]